MISEKNIDLMVRRGIYTEPEYRARYAIHLDSYNKTVGIEARTMVDMAIRQILPAALRYSHELSDTLMAKRNLGLSCNAESALLRQLSQQTDGLFETVNKLRDALGSLPKDAASTARHFQDVVIPYMNSLRSAADALETLTDKSYWPYPTYSDLLYY
jgi:glutamine synthetase